MMQTLVVFFLILDVVLIYIVFQRLRITSPVKASLDDIIEERKIIKELAQDLRQEAAESRARSKESLDKMKLVAAQIEMELKQNSSHLKQSSEAVIKEVLKELEYPLSDIVAQKNSVHALFRRIDAEKKSLTTILSQVEKMKKLFAQNELYQKMIESIEHEKYSDIRRLLAQGMPVEKVAENMGLLVEDVRMIRDMVHS